MGIGATEFILLKEHCSFYRDFEGPGMDEGIGHCHLGKQTKCVGDVKFCGNLEALRNYFLKRGLGWQKVK